MDVEKADSEVEAMLEATESSAYRAQQHRSKRKLDALVKRINNAIPAFKIRRSRKADGHWELTRDGKVLETYDWGVKPFDIDPEGEWGFINGQLTSLRTKLDHRAVRVLNAERDGRMTKANRVTRANEFLKGSGLKLIQSSSGDIEIKERKSKISM